MIEPFWFTHLKKTHNFLFYLFTDFIQSRQWHTSAINLLKHLVADNLKPVPAKQNIELTLIMNLNNVLKLI